MRLLLSSATLGASLLLAACAIPPSPQNVARTVSDGVQQLAAVEARLSAAASAEPRRATDPGAGAYFSAIAPIAQEGWRLATQLQETSTRHSLATTAGLQNLARAYASLEAAARSGELPATRRARQEIAAAMVAVQTATPQLSGA